MFERFTEKAIKVVMLSQEESRRLGHNFVGTEQILLGLIGEGTGVAYKVLRSVDLNLKDARMEVERIIGRGSGFVAVEIPFTPRAKRVLENSIEESRELGHGYIGTEHILLALLDEDDGVAWRLFEDLKIDIEKLRTDVLVAIGADSSDANKKKASLVSGNDEEDREYSLEEYTTNLTDQAREGKLDPVVGREKEIERVIQILVRRKKNNPVLIGEPGVGKTAVAEGLAQRIIQRDVPDILEEKEIVSLDIGLLLAGTKYRGEFEERIKRVMEEVQTSANMILVIDEVHNLIGAGAAEGAVDAANILKPALARGELQCIGATTIEEYRKHIEKDQALERRFQPVNVPEPTIDETIQILRGLRNRYERHHMLRISDAALIAAAKLGAQFIADRFLPDKAIDLIDEASARVRLAGCGLPTAAKELDKELRELIQKKDQAIRDQNFDEAGNCRDLEMEIRAQITAILNAQGGANKNYNPVVEEENIAEIVSAWTGIPVSKVSKSETEKLIHMEEILHQRVIGQDVAVKAISKAIRRARVGLKNPNRPIASFIFSGPTGVGKTELTKALASYFFGSEESMVRLDMSEYMERHNVAKLIGSPPGYVGFSEGGLLTEEVRRKPYTVVLFDEVEKAHPDVFNLLLQILEDGRLTDAQGRLVDFKNSLIILTSNIGSKSIEKNAQSGGFGFDTVEDEVASNYERMSKAVHEDLKQYFRPEFLNRLDEIIVFQQLTRPDVRKIADIMINQLCKRVAEQGINLEVTDAVKEKLSDEGFNPIYGARPLRRTIMNLLEDNLANKFLSESMDKGSNIVVTLDSEKNIQIDITHTEVSSETKNEDDLETVAKQGYRKSALAALQKQQPSV
uniref:Clp protease ATP binding subunit n=1 Tax=Meringosphaera mediterranea TaxID=2837474 RepID=UPI00286BE4CB|nr:Clp protease ATP binding subunit [Meringosphaera mediterranea]WLD05686.1 Clp protease ATP binding subunit [Meringosphaera mediterranea]WLD05796.1 Clp protease ATP binding subunit [Meringosphaera mediterranea]WLD06016.1 Clp protease ATP binding subunit [Meringosphaera mediterranea]